MKTILLFGAGKSATILIEYLLKNAETEHWMLKVVDVDLDLAKSKIGESKYAEALSIDINNDEFRKTLVAQSALTISMLPPHLHFLVAKDCAEMGKHLLTASYLDENMKSLSKQVEQKNILFLCEMGLDPGIDHMSAMKIIDSIRENGGDVNGFRSHCGGLVAPESDDNPWHYKISWNPRNILLAGKAGAHFKENNIEVRLTHEELFATIRKETIPGLGELAWYPNRDSLSYSTLYGLEDASTILRTTLRHPDFISGWKNIIDLQLTDETKKYDTTGMSLAGFFKKHLENIGLSNLANPEQKADLFLEQFLFLGLHDHQTMIDKGFCSAADVMEFVLQKKLALRPTDKDMIVMLHEIDFLKEGKKYAIKSHLVVKGNNALHTAMAKTVGLPLGIAAKLILNGRILQRGVRIPVSKEIYEPVLAELANEGISFSESITELT